MADLYPAVELGAAVKIDALLSFKAEAAITKGQVVKLDTHTDGELGSVSPAGDGDKPIGVALKDAAAGDYVPVLVRGIVKVTAAGAIPLGSKVRTAAGGKVQAVDDQAVDEGGTATYTIYYTSLVGRALQTFADGDTGLIYVDCS